MLLNEGLDETATQFQTIFSKAQYGTATTIPLITDTGLINPISATLLSTTGTASGNSCQLTLALSSAVGNGNLLGEHELRFTDGTSFNRITYTTAIDKTAAYALDTITTITFLRG